MKKRKITVITLQNVRNYGSVLQALATQHVMEQLGLECNFINYYKNKGFSNLHRAFNWSKGNILKRLINVCILYPSFIIDSKLFERFTNKYLHLLPGRYTCEKELEKLPIESDIYCTGSDQTWNSGWNNGILPELFLKFVPDTIKKISYAASIGKSSLDEWEIEETQQLLSRYHAISVREWSAVEICGGLGINATHVLDPTLQVTKDFWMKIASPRLFNEKYVLVYQLNSNPQFDNYAKEFAKRRGCKLIRLCIRHYQALRSGIPLMIPKPEDFISAISYADTVITDSFHATAFSCNLNTPMICIYPNDYSSRLASLLTLTGLEYRHLTDYNDFSFVEKNDVDFTHVNEVLNREREVGYDFLRRAITD